MRVAIIAGLMAVGMLAGCGGSLPAEEGHANEVGTAQQELGCQPCYNEYVVCMRHAGGDIEQQESCMIDRQYCLETCG